jgi:hypothetical protein
MAQQTAVEWLVKELKLEGYNYTVEQAKQMEMEQIAETYRVGVEEDIYNNPLRTGKEYYNDTYKK